MVFSVVMRRLFKLGTVPQGYCFFAPGPLLSQRAKRMVGDEVLLIENVGG